MSESLLSFSEVLLFGREIVDLKIAIPDRPVNQSVDAATTFELADDQFEGNPTIDGVNLAAGERLLVHLQKDKTKNGIYTMTADGVNWAAPQRIGKGMVAHVERGDEFGDTFWQQTMGAPNKQKYKEVPRNIPRGKGQNQFIDEQLMKDARLARIYAFAFEGAFYELPAPAIFLVHGEGKSATQIVDGGPVNLPGNLAARAPNKPDRSGVAAADFQLADDILYWPYDKADYSIRMDVLTGQLEQILLDVFFEVEAPMIAGGRVAGGRVAGGRVAGGRVAGGRVAGGRVAGGRVSGGRVGGSGD